MCIDGTFNMSHDWPFWHRKFSIWMRSESRETSRFGVRLVLKVRGRTAYASGTNGKFYHLFHWSYFNQFYCKYLSKNILKLKQIYVQIAFYAFINNYYDSKAFLQSYFIIWFYQQQKGNWFANSPELKFLLGNVGNKSVNSPFRIEEYLEINNPQKPNFSWFV